MQRLLVGPASVPAARDAGPADTAAAAAGERLKSSLLTAVLAIFGAFLISTRLPAQDAPERAPSAAHSDPVREMDAQRPLTRQEAERLQALFAKLLAQDFDVREEARRKIIEFGPRALEAARQFENSDDPDTRRFASLFSDHILLRYRGYLPLSPRLLASLEQPRRVFIGKQESFADAFGRFARDTGVRVVFEGFKPPELVIGSGQTLEINTTVGAGLQALAAAARLSAVPRGEAVVVTTPERAEALRVQEHSFEIELARDDPLPGLLQAWLPPGAEVSAGLAEMRVRGSDVQLRMAARALHFARKDPALPIESAVFPARVNPVKLFAALAAPVADFKVSGQEPTRLIARLRAAGHAVALDETAAPLTGRQMPVTLDFNTMPLGLCLRWLGERANLPAPDQYRVRLHFSCDEVEPLITAHLLSPETTVPVSETVGAADAAFLYKEGVGTEGDKHVLAQISAELADQSALYPDERSEHAVFVYRRRMFVRGPAPLVAQTLACLESWRAAGQPPVAAWRADLARRLKAEVPWDGTGVTVKTVLPRIREASGINILLQRNERGGPEELIIDANQAHLLPPGKHSAEQLLNRLCQLAGSAWKIQWGAIVLSKSEAKPAADAPGNF